MWHMDEEFVAWLDQEGLGNDLEPLDDATLDLMYQAWQAAAELFGGLTRERHGTNVNGNTNEKPVC